MLKHDQISSRHFNLFIIFFIIGGSILTMPSGLAGQVKQDAWIVNSLGFGTAFLLVWIYSVLGLSYPRMTLVEYSVLIFGSWIGKIISLLYFVYFLLLTSSILRQLGDFLTTLIMPETPIEAIHILFFLVIIMGVRLGLETLGRAAEIFFPWVLILFIFFVICIFPQSQFENIQPILENGIKSISLSFITSTGSPYTQLVIFLMLFPYVNQTKKIRKSFLLGTLIGGMALTLIILLCISVLGADITAKTIYPTYSLAKKINVGNFLQRIEAIVAGIWFITVYFKLTICFYASIISIAQTFTFKDYRFLTYPLGMIIIVLSLVLHPNFAHFAMFYQQTWPYYSLTFGLVIPLFILGATKIKAIKNFK